MSRQFVILVMALTWLLALFLAVIGAVVTDLKGGNHDGE